MDRKPMATIIIPVYNAQAYLEKCLDSALQQTYDNYEIICVNDQSPDDSQRILEEYGKKYSEKLHYICNEENIGQGQSRMRAIGLAKGSALEDAVNAALEELKADGTLQSIVDKYITAE